jgi:hypothetical protein
MTINSDLYLYTAKVETIRDIGNCIKHIHCDMENWLFEFIDDYRLGLCILNERIDFSDYDYKINAYWDKRIKRYIVERIRREN